MGNKRDYRSRSRSRRDILLIRMSMSMSADERIGLLDWTRTGADHRTNGNGNGDGDGDGDGEPNIGRTKRREKTKWNIIERRAVESSGVQYSAGQTDGMAETRAGDLNSNPKTRSRHR